MWEQFRTSWPNPPTIDQIHCRFCKYNYLIPHNFMSHPITSTLTCFNCCINFLIWLHRLLHDFFDIPFCCDLRFTSSLSTLSLAISLFLILSSSSSFFSFFSSIGYAKFYMIFYFPLCLYLRFGRCQIAKTSTFSRTWSSPTQTYSSWGKVSR